MPVLKHISPKVVPILPIDVPLKMVPSANSKIAGNLLINLFNVVNIFAKICFFKFLPIDVFQRLSTFKQIELVFIFLFLKII